MTSPPEPITVECPECSSRYPDWTRSVNLDIMGWDPEDPEVQEYLEKCVTATCPKCNHTVRLGGVLTVKDDVWTFSRGDAR